VRETISRVREAGARGNLTIRADSAFDSRAFARACRYHDVGFSVTVKLLEPIRAAIEAIPEAHWVAIAYWLEGGADVAETTYTAFKGTCDEVELRFIVRRVRPTPASTQTHPLRHAPIATHARTPPGHHDLPAARSTTPLTASKPSRPARTLSRSRHRSEPSPSRPLPGVGRWIEAYWQYSAKIDGKTVSPRPTEPQARLYQKWIANDRQLRAIIAEMRQLAGQAAELQLAEAADT
jgi:hypothetical protein